LPYLRLVCSRSRRQARRTRPSCDLATDRPCRAVLRGPMAGPLPRNQGGGNGRPRTGGYTCAGPDHSLL